MQIEFPSGYSETENLPKTRTMLKNVFNSGAGEVISRPGIDLLRDTTGYARGQFVWNGNLYQVRGEDLIKITDTDTGAFSVVSSDIFGTADIATAVGFNTAVIVVKGGRIYTLDKSDVVARIDDGSNFEPCEAVTHINGRFVYIPSNGANPAFFSDIGAAGTVQAASFFDAEELPDQNTTAFNLRNTLYIAGTDSFELFRDTGATPVPFQRLNGARIDYGYIGGLMAYADTYAFIGREKDLDAGVYAISQGRADKISNPAIDLILSIYTLTDLTMAIGNRIKWRGYDLATWTLPNHSFGFYKGQWFIISRLKDGVEREWSAGFITQFNGEYFSASDQKIGKFSGADSEYGESIPRVIDVPFQEPDNDWFACQSVSLGVSQGYNAGAGTVGLAMTRDGVEYGPLIYRDLGALGKYATHLDWNPPGGLGAYDGFMGVRIYTTQAVDFSANSLFARVRA